jgi:hypothetical protein
VTLDEARAALRNDNGTWFDWISAAAELSTSADSSFADWLLCLSRRGYPAECGACRLYSVTKRPRKDDSIESFITDLEDWRIYLKAENFFG